MNQNPPSPLIDITLFQDAIENDVVIITANQRLANQIHQVWGSINIWQSRRLDNTSHYVFRALAKPLLG